MLNRKLKLTAQALWEETKRYNDAHDFENATIWLDKIAEFAATNIVDPVILMKAANTRGLIHSRKSDYVNAEKFLFLSLDYANQIQDPIFICSRYDNLAGLYSQWGNLMKSIHYLELSRMLKEKTGNERDMHITLLSLTGCYLEMGNTEAAERTLAEAYLYIKKYNITKVYHTYFWGKAGVLENKKRYKEAISSYRNCIKYALEFNEYTTAGRAYSNLGQMYFKLEEWKKAKSAYLKAQNIAQKHKLHGVELRSCIQLGEIALKKNDFKNAREQYDYVRSIILTTDAESLYQDLEELSALLHEAENDYKPALESYKKYLVYYKKQFNNETNRTIQDLQAKYEAEKKDRALEKAKLLQAQSELKALRAQMDPHFIFNALSSMRKEMLEGNLEGADAYLMRFSKLLRMILDTSRTPNIRLSDNIELLHLYIQIEQNRQGNRFDYTITTKGIDPDNTYLPGLILQPLAENAIVHGLYHKKNGQGKLNISFSKTKEALVIKVRDNGVGRLASKGKAKPGHTSHAMAIIRETLDLTWQGRDVKNYFTIRDLMTKDNVNIGTEVTVLLPLS